MSKATHCDSSRDIEEKWTSPALEMGWTAIPTSLFFMQAQLGLTPTEFNVLLNIIIHWWGRNDKIYPSQEGIASRIGISKRTVQRTIEQLVEKNCLYVTPTKRKGKYNGRNLYSLSPLVQSLEISTPIIKDIIQVKKDNYFENH